MSQEIGIYVSDIHFRLSRVDLEIYNLRCFVSMVHESDSCYLKSTIFNFTLC